jgi:hypothetical protein
VLSVRQTCAVILLSGWMLMVPPGDPSAPVQTWKQEEAFDSARACEEAHNEGLSNLLREKESEQRTGTWWLPAFKDINEKFDRDVENYRNGRCVPTEAVYPKPAAK